MHSNRDRNWFVFFRILVFICVVSNLSAQQQPFILLEDMDEHSLDVECYCKPGVRNSIRSKGIEISYQVLNHGNISAPNNELEEPYPEFEKFRKLKFKLSMPLIRGKQLKTIIGFSYEAEQFDFKNINSDYQGLITSLDDISFKSSSVNLNLAYSLNKVTYLGGKLNLAYNGSYDNLVQFSSRYAVYSGGIAYGIKRHEDNEWGFGIAGSKNFRRQGFRVLPFVFWNRTLNDKWGFQLSLPSSINLRYNVNKETILIASTNYNGDSYSFDQVVFDDRAIAFNHSEILTLLKLQRQLVPWLWLDVQAGYHFNFRSNFESQVTQDELFEIDPGNNLLLKVGVFISPPDKFLE